MSSISDNLSKSSIVITIVFLFFFVILGIFFQYVPTISLLSDLTEDAKILSERANIESAKINEILKNTEKIRSVLNKFEDDVLPAYCRIAYIITGETPVECRR